jgi:hypothetical protein
VNTPPTIDSRGVHGKSFCAAGAAHHHIAGVGKMVPLLFKSSLNKNLWQIDPEAGTYQDRSRDHDPLEPVDVCAHLCHPDLYVDQAGISLFVVRVLISFSVRSYNSLPGRMRSALSCC